MIQNDSRQKQLGHTVVFDIIVQNFLFNLLVVRNKHNLLALAFVRHGNNAVTELGAHPFIGLNNHILHGIQ